MNEEAHVNLQDIALKCQDAIEHERSGYRVQTTVRGKIVTYCNASRLGIEFCKHHGPVIEVPDEMPGYFKKVNTCTK